MRWEAAFWVGLALGSPALAQVFWPRLKDRLGDWAELAERFAPWAHGFIPAYLALFFGSIRARDAGVIGRGPLDWVGGMLACGLWLGLAALLKPEGGTWPEPTRGVLDEPRWTLYRAAGGLWVGHYQFGVLVGLGLAAVEWWLGVQSRRSVAWETLARMASSTVVFGLTRNFWLAALSQAALLAILRRGAATRQGHQ